MQPKQTTLSVAALGALALAAGCGLDVPDSPTWAQDVAPILAANCVRCHTVPAIGGAPSGFRLDTYDDWVDDQGHVVRGAGTMALYVIQRVEHETLPMPPRYPLDARQIDTLKAWAASLGGDRRPLRGEPGLDNQPPVMTLLGTTRTGDILRLDYEIRDPDHDIVVGELRAGDRLITRELHSGRGVATWDVGAVPAGTYALSAVLDDGSGLHTVEAGEYQVDNPAGVAPTVRILSPRPDDLVAGNVSPIFAIQVLVDDPDSEELTMTVQARSDGQLYTVVTGEPVQPGEVTAVDWDITELPEGLWWHLIVTVSDGAATRTAESGPFILSNRTTTETFAAIRDQVLSRCTFCHPSQNIPGLPLDLTQLIGEGNTLGAKDLGGLLYRRAVQERTMPPLVWGGPLDDVTAGRLGDWLLAGAPE